jgi:isoquinoline 1-oxidoreductase
MTPDRLTDPAQKAEEQELAGPVLGLTRRTFVKLLGAGLVITVLPVSALAQRKGGGGGGGGGQGIRVSARVHLGKDGSITVMTGKVEGGQGARAEISQAAAEELRVPAGRIQLIMADTSLVPDDGITAGSMTTPRTLPPVRQGAAAARDLLVQLAAKRWGVDGSSIEVRDGKVIHADGKRELTYADLAADEEAAKALEQGAAAGVTVTAVKEWKVLGTSVPRPNGRDLVTGAHRFPSDIARPGMLYGKVLRAPSYGAKLTAVDLAPAKAMKDVVAVHDGAFVGVAAPTAYLAEQALAAVAKTATWEQNASQPSNKDVYDYLRKQARSDTKNPFADDVAKAAKSLRQTYHVAYVQHTPMEPRAAVAEWGDGGNLTVWTGTQNPFGCHSEVARALGVANDKVRVIVPDFGGGFGGKHTGEASVEVARLAKAAGKPVQLRWTRREEFTWAYFRPAAVIDLSAGLDDKGLITSWYHININASAPGIETPYRAGKAKSQSVASDSPLRTGSYRALATTGNNFARESFMDELALAAGQDPLEFRLAHLDNPRLRAVLEEAAKRFDWTARAKKKEAGVGVGLACGTDKGSYVAACVEVSIREGRIAVRHVCQAFECGAILNPGNLLSQVQGAITMGLGPALREEMEFKEGRILNASFEGYLPPRFRDVPELDIHLLNRPDLPSAGAGETPITAIAPAIANAVFHATGERVRQMPIRLAKAAAS